MKTMKTENKWQWIDANFGPMGWFSNAEKRKFAKTPFFKNGQWRFVPPDEVVRENAAIARRTSKVNFLKGSNE